MVQMVCGVGVKLNEGCDIEVVRRDWTRAEADALYNAPFSDLMFRAQAVHRHHFDPNHVETASLLSIKTGGCPEDCGYCSQSAHYDTGLTAARLMEKVDVIATASARRRPVRFGSAWRRRGAVRRTATLTRSARWSAP
jgi:biotin synthase